MFYRLFRVVAKYIVYGNIIWVTAIFICRSPRGMKQVENDQPGQNDELVPKRGTYICSMVTCF